MASPPADLIEAGHAALDAAQWEREREAFDAALRHEESPEALEGLGWATWWLGVCARPTCSSNAPMPHTAPGETCALRRRWPRACR
ncbi:MAG: hypothetical protein ACRDKW_14095, partial [Actinomycetota bacterium]